MNLSTLKNKAQFLKKKLGILYFAFQDPRTPWPAKLLIVLVIAYALSPVDVIPDFIPLLGYLDDLLLIPGGIALAIKLIPEEVLLEAAEKQSDVINTVKYKVIGGIIVIAIWALLIYFIVQAFR